MAALSGVRALLLLVVVGGRYQGEPASVTVEAVEVGVLLSSCLGVCVDHAWGDMGRKRRHAWIRFCSRVCGCLSVCVHGGVVISDI